MSKHPKESTPIPAAASTNMGNTLQELGNYTAALAHHRLAAQLSPDTPDAHYNLGVTLIALGNTQEASKLWQERALKGKIMLQRLANAGPWTPHFVTEERKAARRIAKQSVETTEKRGHAAETEEARHRLRVLLPAVTVCDLPCAYRRVACHAFAWCELGRRVFAHTNADTLGVWTSCVGLTKLHAGGKLGSCFFLKVGVLCVAGLAASL